MRQDLLDDEMANVNTVLDVQDEARRQAINRYRTAAKLGAFEPAIESMKTTQQERAAVASAETTRIR